MTLVGMGAKTRKPEIVAAAEREINCFSELNCKITISQWATGIPDAALSCLPAYLIQS